jgi:hypothetical protein
VEDSAECLLARTPLEHRSNTAGREGGWGRCAYVDGMAFWSLLGVGRTSSSGASGPPEAPVPTLASAAPPPRLRWPRDWCGKPFGGIEAARTRFPCMGAACAAQDGRNEMGTRCHVYRDTERYLSKDCAWQHKCEECCNSGEHIWSAPAAPESAMAAAAAAQVAAPSIDDIIDVNGPLIDQAISDALAPSESEGELTAPGERLHAEASVLPPPPSLPPPLPQRPAQPAIPTPLLAAAPIAPPPTLVAPPVAPTTPTLTHDDERLRLGKPLWTAIARRFPRPQHIGSLAMPRPFHLEPMKLDAMLHDFPQLPYVEPEAAEAQAMPIAMWDGCVCCMHMEANACAPVARERKRQKQPEHDRAWAGRVKRTAITVTLTQLQDPTYKIANLRLRRIAGMVGVKQKLAPPQYTSLDCRRLVAEAMINGNDRIAPCRELVVQGDVLD